MKARDLGLVGDALTVACEVEQYFPEAVFTRGRTDRAGQARAMAQNIAQSHDGIAWLRATYRESDSIEKVIDAVGACTRPFIEQAVETALVTLFSSFTDDELAEITKHPSGHAFDVQPTDSPWGVHCCSFMGQRARELGGRFLEKEGDLCRWHWQAK